MQQREEQRVAPMSWSRASQGARMLFPKPVPKKGRRENEFHYLRHIAPQGQGDWAEKCSLLAQVKGSFESHRFHLLKTCPLNLLPCLDEQPRSAQVVLTV